MPTSTEAAGHLMLDRETDARFWAQTGYKVGQKLDLSNPTDKAMAKVWLDIFHKVAAEDRAGKLVLTFNHPKVEQALGAAQAAHDAAVTHLEAAQAAPDDAAAREHTQAAATAAAVAQQKASEAATVQPPTASPEVAHAASVEAHAKAQTPPPGVVVFPVGHPVHWHPNAKPAGKALAAVDTTPAAPPASAEDHLALAQAGQAPAMTGAALVNGAHWSYSDYQTASDRAFAALGAPAGVVSYGKDGAPVQALASPSYDAASSSYDALVNNPGDAWYVALYDAARGRVDETYLGGVQVEHTTHTDTSHNVTRIVHDTAPGHGLSFAQKLAVGGLVAASVAAIVFTMTRTGGTVTGRPASRLRTQRA